MKVPEVSAASFALLVACAGMLASGCGEGSAAAGAPLPPEDNLHRYSVAVAEHARRLLPPASVRALFNLGKVHQRFGMDDLAVAAYERCVDTDAFFAPAHREIGFILSQRENASAPDRMRLAVESYQMALRADPQTPGMYSRIGLVLTHMGLLAEAEEALDAESRLAGGRADALTLYHLGNVRRLRDRLEPAAEAFRQALAVEPRMREALSGLADSLRLLGRSEEAAKAREEFLAVKRAEDEAEAAARAGEDNRRTERGHASAAWLDAADALLEEAGRSTAGASRAMLQREAQRAVREAVRLDPANRDAVRMLARTLRSEGQGAAALDALEKSVAAAPSDPVLLFELAHAHLLEAGKGNPAGAQSSISAARTRFTRALELEPDLAEARLALAELLLRYGSQPSDLEIALGHASRAFELQQQPKPSHYDILAWAQSRTGSLPAALETLKEGVRRFPTDPGLTKRLGQLAERLK